MNKPAGLPTQGVPEAFDSLEQRVRNFIRTTRQKPGNVYLGIPHRLDRPVSGVVVFSRNSKCAARLAEQFRDRAVRKIYWAITQSAPVPAAGVLEDWLVKIPDQARAALASQATPHAKLARLSYRTLLATASYSLIEIELETGRMHQIRIQLASRGWPIVGDTTYETSDESEATPRPAPNEILLHARSLALKHPIRYDDVQIIAPLPAFWPQEVRDLALRSDPND